MFGFNRFHNLATCILNVYSTVYETYIRYSKLIFPFKSYLLTLHLARESLPHKNLISRMDWVSSAGDINLPHIPFLPARSPPNKKLVYFLQSPYLFTIDRLFLSIVEMFRRAHVRYDNVTLIPVQLGLRIGPIQRMGAN